MVKENNLSINLMLTEEQIKQHAEDYHKHVEELNTLSQTQIDNLIMSDDCPYEPQHLLGVPLGMFHCPLCGEMVVAGVPHPRQTPPYTDEELAQISSIAGEAEKVPVDPVL